MEHRTKQLPGFKPRVVVRPDLPTPKAARTAPLHKTPPGQIARRTLPRKPRRDGLSQLNVPQPTQSPPLACAHATVVAALLRHARDSRFKLPEEPADHLQRPVETILTMESGAVLQDPDMTEALLRLYKRNADAGPVRRQLTDAAKPALRGTCVDGHSGHGRRLAAVESQASATTWMSVTILPEPLQIPEYAHAVRDARQAADYGTAGRRPQPGRDVYLLESDILRREAGGAEVMARQLTHLVRLVRDGVADIRIWPSGTASLVPATEHLGELTFHNGTTLLVSQGAWVEYSTDTSPRVAIETAWRCAATGPQSLALLETKAQNYSLSCATNRTAP
ncbi:Scr1 family TA system antitoxin-like transcriptional regulator [Streptomyces sp. NPDC055036]